MSNDLRLLQLKDWLTKSQSWTNFRIEPASADASFRRYFRIYQQDQHYIAMDAPPDKEDSQPFLAMSERLAKTGVHVPQIYASSLAQGFMLLEDLGTMPYQRALQTPESVGANMSTTQSPAWSLEQANTLYTDAMYALIQMQQADFQGLEPYDHQRLQTEMQLMPDWFLKVHLGLPLSKQQSVMMDDIFAELLRVIAEQPQGFVHRDYHSRNLMQVSQNNPGIIDYQDAVYGALTYDLVSLLRDCYVCWPQAQVERWALQYRDLAVAAQVMPAVDDTTFLRWFDWMGLQRHIKVLGIFARLYHRDGKAHYLQDLPLTLSYVLTVAAKYPATQPLVALFHELNIPETIGTVEIPA
ncbi:MAG: aminoglycoside phosphotransferase family protein [bacterium]